VEGNDGGNGKRARANCQRRGETMTKSIYWHWSSALVYADGHHVTDLWTSFARFGACI
jgi:hypothetical protein